LYIFVFENLEDSQKTKMNINYLTIRAHYLTAHGETYQVGT
jgi:hypothetical protein